MMQDVTRKLLAMTAEMDGTENPAFDWWTLLREWRESGCPDLGEPEGEGVLRSTEVPPFHMHAFRTRSGCVEVRNNTTREVHVEVELNVEQPRAEPKVSPPEPDMWDELGARLDAQGRGA